MKIKTKFIILFFSMIIIAHSSCNECRGLDPIYPTIDIKLVNDEGENLIDSIYIEETYQFVESTSNKTIFSERVALLNGNSHLSLGFDAIHEDIDYYLTWDSNDTDTLSFKWNTSDGVCAILYELIEVKHNHLKIDFEMPHEHAKVVLIQ